MPRVAELVGVPDAHRDHLDGYGIHMSDNAGALTGGLAGVVVVAVVVVILGTSMVALLPLIASAVFLAALLVREVRGRPSPPTRGS